MRKLCRKWQVVFMFRWHLCLFVLCIAIDDNEVAMIVSKVEAMGKCYIFMFRIYYMQRERERERKKGGGRWCELIHTVLRQWRLMYCTLRPYLHCPSSLVGNMYICQGFELCFKYEGKSIFVLMQHWMGNLLVPVWKPVLW